jgi:hypothetical protein
MDQFQLAFGGHPRQIKESDFNLGTLTPSISPATFMPSYGLVTKMQGHQPECGADSGSELKEILNVVSGNPYIELSDKFLWNQIKQIDQLPLDAGTDMGSIMKVLQKTGICRFDLTGDDTTVSEQQFVQLTVTPEMITDAATHKIGTYAFTNNPTFQQIKDAIYQHKAVILLLRVGAEWWTKPDGTGSWQEKDILPLRTTVPITSGHFVVAYAYDEKYIYFQNHWSALWGRNGIGYFAADYASRCIEMGTAVDVSTTYQFTKVLKLGMTSTDVGLLQQKLKTLGFFPAAQSITSYFGPVTLKAVEAFQSTQNLTNDGIVGAMTNTALNKA